MIGFAALGILQFKNSNANSHFFSHSSSKLNEEIRRDSSTGVSPLIITDARGMIFESQRLSQKSSIATKNNHRLSIDLSLAYITRIDIEVCPRRRSDIIRYAH